MMAGGIAIDVAFTIVSIVVGGFITPIAICFYSKPLNIYDHVMSLLVKQSTASTLIAVSRWLPNDRTVTDGQQLKGTNFDIMRLLYPKRYLFIGLTGATHLLAGIGIGVFIFRVAAIQVSSPTMSQFFADENGTIPLPVVGFAVCCLLFFVTITLAIFQKTRLRGYIDSMR